MGLRVASFKHEEYFYEMEKETIGKILKAAREKAGISINKLAIRLCTGHERVKALEEGRGNYGIDLLIAYAKAVNYTVVLVEGVASVEKVQEVTAPIKTTLHKAKIAESIELAGEKKKKRIVIEEAD